MDSKLKQLHANSGQTSVFAEGEPVQVITDSQPAINVSGEASVLHRISQVVSQSVALIAKPRQAQGAYADAAMT